MHKIVKFSVNSMQDILHLFHNRKYTPIPYHKIKKKKNFFKKIFLEHTFFSDYILG